jgi:membrane protein YdbS with pleckstrin-like domain
MLALVVRMLRPLFLPVLKLKLEAPKLPEGTALVRELKPEPGWLTLRYLRVALGSLGPFFGTLGGTAGLVVALGGTGIAIAALLWLVVLGTIGFGLVSTRLDYELRHYLVGDKSLRVSQGALTRREATLSYANVQNLEVSQGPIEGLLGLKSLTVSTAGGGAVRPGEANLHQVKLEGLKNAEEVKQLIMGMLKGAKDAGLGEPAASAQGAAMDSAALEDVRAAALALRTVAESLTVSALAHQAPRS